MAGRAAPPHHRAMIDRLCALPAVLMIACAAQPKPAAPTASACQEVNSPQLAQLFKERMRRGYERGLEAGLADSERKVFNLSVRDGRMILEDLRKAREALKQVEAALAPLSGDRPANSASLEPLLEVARPVDASMFVGRRYMAFRPRTVDALMRYYLAVLAIWDELEHVAAIASTRADPSAAIERVRSRLQAAQSIETDLLRELEAIAAVPEKKLAPPDQVVPDVER
jgi:hypothetical protein